MATLIALLVFTGFYSFYLTSKRADYQLPLFVGRLIQIPRFTSIAGGAFFMISILLSIQHFGFGAGILMFFIVLMTAGSLIVVLAPIGMLNYKALVSTLLCALVLELLF